MRSENVRRAGWSTCLDTGTVSGTSASPVCRGTYCSGPQAAWPCEAGSPTATRHTCTSRRKDPVQVVLPGSQVASRGNLWTRKHNLHTRQSISLTYWHQLPMYLLVLNLHCVLRHRLATSSCRGHVHESATRLYLSPHREHGTGCRHSWSCCGRSILFIA